MRLFRCDREINVTRNTGKWERLFHDVIVGHAVGVAWKAAGSRGGRPNRTGFLRSALGTGRESRAVDDDGGSTRLCAGKIDAACFVPAATKGLDGDRLAVHPLHFRLVIEGVDMTGTTVHEQENHRLPGYGAG